MCCIFTLNKAQITSVQPFNKAQITPVQPSEHSVQIIICHGRTRTTVINSLFTLVARLMNGCFRIHHLPWLSYRITSRSLLVISHLMPVWKIHCPPSSAIKMINKHLISHMSDGWHEWRTEETNKYYGISYTVLIMEKNVIFLLYHHFAAQWWAKRAKWSPAIMHRNQR